LGYNEKAVSVLLSASFTINYGDRRLFGVNLAEKSHQCPLINLLNHAFELYSSTESELTIRTFWYLGLCEMFVQKMSMKSEGQRKKMLDIGHFPQHLNGENYRQPWDLNDKTRRLNCFFCPNLAEIDAMPPFFSIPCDHIHSDWIDWISSSSCYHPQGFQLACNQ
jgi:hypothetical protein